MKGKIDPALRAALAAAKKGTRDVEAIVMLVPTDESVGVDSPDETIRKGKALVARVRKAVGRAPGEVNVFENLQSMAIRADAQFIEELIAQPEVGSAMSSASTKQS